MLTDYLETLIRKPDWSRQDRAEIIVYTLQLLDINQGQADQLMVALKKVSEQEKRIEFYRNVYMKAIS